MSFTASVLRDLCVVCADAPDLQNRGAAHRLLAHEMATRLRNSGREYNFGDHPAFTDDKIRDFITLPGGILVEARQGGIDPAVFYFWSKDGTWSGSTPRDPDTDYPEVFPALNSEATTLIASVRSAMTHAWT